MRIVPIVLLGVVCGDKMLLIKRVREPFSGLWSFLGGKIEVGETFFEAGVREVIEEAGISVDVGGVELVGVVDEFIKNENELVHHNLISLCRAQVDSLDVVSSEEGELSWFSFEELRSVIEGSCERREKFNPCDLVLFEKFFESCGKDLKMCTIIIEKDKEGYYVGDCR